MLAQVANPAQDIAAYPLCPAIDQHLQEQARAARGTGPDELGQLPARKPASQLRV